MSCCKDCYSAIRTEITTQSIKAISLNLAKLQAGLEPDETYQDVLISQYIDSAARLASDFIGKTLLTTGYRAYWNYLHECLEIRDHNVGITALKYIDTDGNEQEITDFEVQRREHVTMVYTSEFPSTKDIPEAVFIDYTAGWGFVQKAVSLTRVDSLVTGTTAVAHQALTGNIITIEQAEAGYNGDFIISVIDSNQLTYTIDTEPTTPGSGVFVHRLLNSDIQTALAMMTVRMLSNRGDCSDKCGAVPCDALTLLNDYKDASIQVVCLRG